MGYSTEFDGEFNIDRPLHPKIREFLVKFSETRRMKRKVPEELYGIDGEFYVEGEGNAGQDKEDNIIDYNTPPTTQPGLWCEWGVNDEGTEIRWDGGEKFYEYEEWIKYIIDKILAPNNYIVNGEIKWQGEDMNDRGKIIVKDNEVTIIGLE